ncbi:serine/threonine-protein phosphatase [Streptomyces sp. NBC_00237]|uniref:PP2C family protein-serine/threonine phosphatase n=1 Tax=Streptomyces sp. NBC_00237 TaxID=2975687 RepID=UPI002258C819|nr:PP2C family protein-serine/threonine phosphatase [Streptomyces sp. NBC_00237]MCX5199873.1 serine/threonine-protein phosphatase [Streptomyces sp. NBC_00237]
MADVDSPYGAAPASLGGERYRPHPVRTWAGELTVAGYGRDGHGGDASGGPGDGRSGVPQESGRKTRRFVRALPALMIVGGIFFDALTPDDFTSSPLFAAAPLVAAPFFSLANTGLTAVASILAVLGLRVADDEMTTVVAVTELVTVLTVSVLAILINRVVRRSGRQLASVRVIAEAAQRAVVPTPSDRIGGLEIAARYEAAEADAFIGGDLFAVQDTPYGVRLVVGDVRGKGLEAVEAVAVVVGAFREAAETEGSLEGVAQRLERALEREGTRRDGLDALEGFTTAVLAEIPRGEGVVRLVNRGHPEPLLLYADGELDVLEPEEFALPLGMGDLGDWPDRAREFTYPPGSTLVFYTDGLSEARDQAGVFYDPAVRLRRSLFPGPEAVLDALTSDVRVHTGGKQTDDMALLAVGRPGVGQPGRRRTVEIVKRP